MTTARPRTAVIDEAWRRAVCDTVARLGTDPLTVMTGRDGGPLARTVKCLIDPLVLRIRANPALGRPLLEAGAQAEAAELIAAATPRIADAALWFAELKRQRRAAGITGGNIQEQYFPRAFELAVAYGPPGPDAPAVAAETIDDIHRPSEGRSVDDLTAYLDHHHADLDAELDRVWAVAPHDRAPHDRAPAVENAAALLGALLTGEATDRARDARWERLTDSGIPGALGLALFAPGSPLADLLASCAIAAGADPPALSATTPAARPALRSVADVLPLDRSIASRVGTTLRRSRDRGDLPAIDEMVTAEIERSRAPWALDGPAWQAAMLVGVVVAAQLHPLEPQPCVHDVAADLSRRLAAQAHIAYTRRYLLSDIAVTAGLADDLAAFWRPYLNRLWVRLHGRSVTEPDTGTAEFDSAALLELLDGIARSVSYDQRSRIRAAIEKAGR
ncbi:hypothetical protein GII30_16460 [Gordonia amarae]|uniref:Uncharacterized protein n=2 Tax=Gordonia amarae TaxID=36821 RepID=G7GV60_9ACTN|nr:hypothetical protein [Gordonia amarae]MCS3880005.1 hypothetical protein [Gordonia amarae]QHN18390.1 hypothetical protein GII35_16775 [Gordonia amarae]QHN22872.1 hypothetical protein GII34_16315 [Gordonia amarae]QHN40521.1 hypothetical protein GII30_16460 [Gordonia amarae]GAB07485.1 hypothetical protein GOAMR_69_00020 [Gordonia amarae NBRC 15530]